MGLNFISRIFLYSAFFLILAAPENGACFQQSASSDLDNSSKPNCDGNACLSTPAPAGNSPEGTSKDVPQEVPVDTSMTLKKMFVNLPGDQKAIWTSPFRVRLRDSIWVAPMVGAT